MRSKYKKYIFILYILTFLFLGLYLGQKGFHIDTHFFNILSQPNELSEVKLVQKEIDNRFSKKIIFLFQWDKKDHLDPLIKNLNDQIKNSGYFDDQSLKQKEELFFNLHQFYFKNRNKFLTPSQIKEIESNQLHQRTRKVKAKIYSLFGTETLSLIREDPLGFYKEFISQSHHSFQFENYKSELVKFNGSQINIIKILSISEKTNDSELIHFINQLKYQFKKSYKASIFITSPQLYSYAGTHLSLLESSKIGIFSIILVVALFWISFRSFSVLFMTFTLCALSVGSGFVFTQLFFKSIHIMTLLLGTSIVGLVSDYCIHFFYFSNPHSNSTNKIFRPMFLGLLSSVFGYLSFYFVPLSILAQLSIFSVTGLITAFLTVYYFFPLIHFKINPVFFSFLNPYIHFWENINSKVKLIYTIPLLIFLILANLLFVQFDHSVNHLAPPFDNLKQDETKILSELGLSSPLKNMIIFGKSIEEVLTTEEEIIQKIKSKNITPIIGVSQWVPSLKRQKESIKNYKKIIPEIHKLYSSLNLNHVFNPQINDDFVDFTSWKDNFKELPILDQWLGQIGDHFYTTLKFSTPENNFSILNMLKVLSPISTNWTLYDKAQELSFILKHLKENIIKSMIYSLLTLFILGIFFFSLKNTFLMFAAPLIGVFTALLFSQIFLGTINLFNLLSCILIFTLGVDYSFYFHNLNPLLVKESQKDLQKTVSAIFASVLTTIGVFGILVISETPSVTNFGLTLFIGILVTFIFSPISLKSVRRSNVSH